MNKIGAITIGQSPRLDITSDILPILGTDIQLIEKGALDGLRADDIEKFAPGKDDYVLVSKMRDGREVKFAERHIIPLIQNCIEEFEQQGVCAIIFFCTGNFPQFKSTVPLIFPNMILYALVPILAENSKIAVLTPNKAQLEQSRTKWEKYVHTVIPIAASPYKDPGNEMDRAAIQIINLDVDLVVMDCIGYSQAMKQRLKKQTGKKILLSRTLMARMIREFFD